VSQSGDRPAWGAAGSPSGLEVQDNDLLRGLSAQELQRILPLFEQRRYSAGEVILRWSESGDRLYIVESGQVRVVVPQNSGAETVIAELGPGQVFGEMAMLTGQPRTANVRAVVPTVVQTIGYSAFFSVAGHSPILLLNLGRVLAARLSRMLRSSSQEEQRALVVLLGLSSAEVGSLVATNLAAALADVSRRRSMLLDAAGPRAARLPGREWAPSLDEIRNGEQTLVHLSQLPVGAVTVHVVRLPEHDGSVDGAAVEQAGRAVTRLARVVELIVINLVGQPRLLADRLLPLATRVCVLSPGHLIGDAQLDELTRRCRQLMAPRSTLDLIAFSRDVPPPALRERARAALGTVQCVVLPAEAELLQLANRTPAPFVLRVPGLGPSREIRRLARSVAGLRVGLALSGGAAKGVAHVGVIKALTRLGVTIDAIAGTSIGSLVGAGLAMGMTMDQIEETMNRLVDLWAEALKPVVPRFSLVASGGLDRIVRELAGDVQFHELPTPFGAVATDLTSGRPVFICQGPVARAVRASISIPLVFPPVQVGDYTLVDGFVSNPIPTQLVRLLGADVVLASNLSALPGSPDQWPIEYRDAPPDPNQRRAGVPNIVQTYLRCADIMMTGRGEHDSLGADLVLRPRLPDMSWKDFQKGGAPMLAGEQAVEAELGRLRELLPWLRPVP
jgi:NTE family protein